MTTVVANESRPDVARSLGDNGLHGFTLLTPNYLKDGRRHDISATFEYSLTSLSMTPQSITCSINPDYVGYLDWANCDTIYGWAADRKRPNTPINVSLYDGPNLLQTVLADQFRADVANSLFDNGAHGFTVTTPASLKDGQTHSVTAKFEASNTSLGTTPQAVTCASNYVGYLDWATCDTIHGWAADLNRPNQSINVSLYDGGILIATLPANESRPDVGKSLGDNGLHGFTVATPDYLKNGQPHTITAKFESSNTSLTMSPRAITCSLVSDYVGYLDWANCTTIYGWAADRNRPNTPIDVSIYDGTTLLQTVPANVSRSDVGAALGDNGLHGFTMITPNSLKDGRPHSIAAKFESSNINLGTSPQTLNCAENYVGYLEWADCDTIHGWAADLNRLNQSINVSLYDGPSFIATVLANGARSDVARSLGDNGMHGFAFPTPSSLKNGQPHFITAKFEQSVTELSSSPQPLNCSTSSDYIGYLDWATCDTIYGWAADRNRLNQSINISVYDGATLIATVLANESRSDVGSFLGDNGLHGFTLVTPASLKNGQLHSIAATYENTSISLGTSPQSMTCQSNAARIQIDIRDILLGQRPYDSGLDQLNKLNGNHATAERIKAIMNAEYQQRFGR